MLYENAGDRTQGFPRARRAPYPLSHIPSLAFIFQSQIFPPLVGNDSHPPPPASYKKQVSLVIRHLSIWDRNLVSKIPLVRSRSEICPRKRSPCRVRSIRIRLTISPRYIPLVIFSYLFGEEGKRRVGEGRKVLSEDARLGVESKPLAPEVHGSQWAGRLVLRLSKKQYRQQGAVRGVDLRATWDPSPASCIPSCGMRLYCKLPL